MSIVFLSECSPSGSSSKAHEPPIIPHQGLPKARPSPGCAICGKAVRAAARSLDGSWMDRHLSSVACDIWHIWKQNKDEQCAPEHHCTSLQAIAAI